MKPDKADTDTDRDAAAEARVFRRIVTDGRRGRTLRTEAARFVNDSSQPLAFPTGYFTAGDSEIPDHLRSIPPPPLKTVEPGAQVLFPEGTREGGPKAPAWRQVPNDPDVPHVAEIAVEVRPLQAAISEAERRITVGNQTRAALHRQVDELETEIGRAEGRQVGYEKELAEGRRKMDEVFSAHSEKWRVAALSNLPQPPAARPPTPEPEPLRAATIRDGGLVSLPVETAR